MKFIDHLSKDNIRKFNQLRRIARDKDNRDIPKTKPKTKKKKKENLSYRDLIDLMGTNRDTYKRVGGAVRRR